jgi:DNA-binding response OmpR family regulator
MLLARVLIIESDLELAETVAEGLSERGLSVHTVHEPSQGIEWLLDQRNPRPDLLLLDMPPPVENMRWFLEAARENGRTATVPILGTVSLDGVPAEIRRHCAHFVWKPYTIESLIFGIELVLRERAQRGGLLS